MHTIVRYALIPVAYTLFAGIRVVDLMVISYNLITAPLFQRWKRTRYRRQLSMKDESLMQQDYVLRPLTDFHTFEKYSLHSMSAEGIPGLEQEIFVDTQEGSRLLRKVEDTVI